MAKSGSTLSKWPAEKVELWPIDKIRPYPKNPRTHPQAQIDALAADMLEDGVTMPILVDEAGVIIAGHGRRLSALKNGFTEYPVVIARGWSEERKHAVRLKDNTRPLMSGWDRELVVAEIGVLKAAGYEIRKLGFPESQLRAWGVAAAADPGRDPEAVPEPPKRPVVLAGDIWTLGQHRLACGDSTDARIWKRLLDGHIAAMAFTDPPYGVTYKADGFAVIEGDKKRRDDLYKMLVGALRNVAKAVSETGAVYIWHASATREEFAQAMKAAGLLEQQYLMWVKPTFAFGRADYQWAHEPCFYACRGQPKFYGDRAQSTVWHVQTAGDRDIAAVIGNGVLLVDGHGGSLFIQAKAPKAKKLRHIRVTEDVTVHLTGDHPESTVWQVGRDAGYQHPTQKPVELARRAIENSSLPGEIVVDAFLGSGTTMIGAEMTGRRCFGIELDPVYGSVIVQRWQKFAGAEATLDGVPYSEIAKRRK